MKRELKWYATKQLFNTQKKAAMEGARNERDVRCVKKKKSKMASTKPTSLVTALI